MPAVVRVQPVGARQLGVRALGVAEVDARNRRRRHGRQLLPAQRRSGARVPRQPVTIEPPWTAHLEHTGNVNLSTSADVRATLPRVTSSQLWDAEDAARYEASSSEMYAPEVLEPTLDFLERRAGPAGDRSALELAIGTGRVGVPLRRRGVAVQGIELSPHMVAELRRTADEAELPVAVGDMATTVVNCEFALVYLVFNTLANLRTQAEQVQCFRNAARHLASGGLFVIEIWVPPLRRLPPGQLAAPFDVTEQHLGFDTYDLVTQRGTSHHFTREDDGSYRRGESLFRFVWPSECDLMAQLAGLELHERYADWDESPFTSDSTSHVSVWRKP